MTTERRRELRRLEGRTVCMALAGGTRLDDVSLISAGTETVWVFANGQDVFVPSVDVLDVWASQTRAAA